MTPKSLDFLLKSKSAGIQMLAPQYNSRRSCFAFSCPPEEVTGGLEA